MIDNSSNAEPHFITVAKSWLLTSYKLTHRQRRVSTVRRPTANACHAYVHITCVSVSCTYQSSLISLLIDIQDNPKSIS